MARETTNSEAVDRNHAGGRSPLRWAAIGLVALLIAAGLFVWQQAGGGGGSLNALAKAAEVTEHEPGGHAAVHGIISKDGKTIVMTGTMVFDDAGNISGVFSFPDPKSGRPLKMQMVGDDGTMYMSSGLFGSLPGGANWMKFDFSPGNTSGSPIPSTGDPTEGLRLLNAVDNVEKLGREDVRGVAATRYRGTTGPADKPLQVEAWIDGDGRIVRTRLVNSLSAHGEGAAPKIDMRTDFYDFGPIPPIKAPDPSEVFDATALTES